MYSFRAMATALLLSLVIVSPSLAAKRKAPRSAVSVTAAAALGRVAFAVDGAESSHGADPAMWQADPNGPQGPMQVSVAAATDVGGGDRFDIDQNREIGRAYLAQLYRRYRDWPDAIAAYNWGIGNLDAWLKAGRPSGGLVPEVVAYLGRVLRDSGLCRGSPSNPARQAAATTLDCEGLSALPGLIGKGRYPLGTATSPFYNQLDRALKLALEHAGSQ
jgi:Transglycosylase SLT domain